ncbi:histidine phosphatase family protein [Bacillus sp. MMSF_3328]|uniref:histidine phosphatase family protein n=1 Tax=Bacillus sp. MMSF_3328 TaxID=3047080 RepID=UPI0027402833|nr:histidine phosphatase family protein [Bacillus sp. MMSF_3328]
MLFMDGTVAVTLFRHVLTEQNRHKAYLGWSDSALCHEEKRRFEGWARSLPEFPFIFSSDLGRCLETAGLLPGGDALKLKELREINFGRWEGSVYEELKNDPAYQAWLNDPFTAPIPEGEDYGQFSERVMHGWEKIRTILIRHQGTRAAVVTHGGVIRQLLTMLAPEERPFWEWRAPHAGAITLIWEDNGFRRGERCTLLLEEASTGKLPG